MVPLADLCVSQQSAERPGLVASDHFIKANLELNMLSRMTLYPAVSAAHAMESIIGSASRARVPLFAAMGQLPPKVVGRNQSSLPTDAFPRCCRWDALSRGIVSPYPQEKIRGIDLVREAIFTVWCSQRVHFELIVSVRYRWPRRLAVR